VLLAQHRDADIDGLGCAQVDWERREAVLGQHTSDLAHGASVQTACRLRSGIGFDLDVATVDAQNPSARIHSAPPAARTDTHRESQRFPGERSSRDRREASVKLA
jgi:hypothetical protein